MNAHWPSVPKLTVRNASLLFINYPYFTFLLYKLSEGVHNENSDYNEPNENLGLLPKVTDCIHFNETIC